MTEPQQSGGLTLALLRRFWRPHRHPTLLFPNRQAGLKGAHLATSPLDRGGVQLTLRHHSILTTAKYTHLTAHTGQNATALINKLMNGFSIDCGRVK